MFTYYIFRLAITEATMLIFVALFIQVVDGQAGLIQQVAWVHVVQEVKPQQEIAPILHNAMGVHFAIQTIHQSYVSNVRL
jgi:hypothetical protein